MVAWHCARIHWDSKVAVSAFTFTNGELNCVALLAQWRVREAGTTVTTRLPRNEMRLSNEDAEQAVLAAILLESASLDSVSPLLEPGDFSLLRHRKIMSAMLRLAGRGCAIDPLTLGDDLDSHGELAAVGGKDYIGVLLYVVPTAANVAYHAAIVREHAQRRTLASVLEEGTKLAIAAQRSPADLADDIRSALETVERSRVGGLRVAVRALDVADPEPIRFAIEDIVTAGDIGLLVGDGGAFKSGGAIHMAAAIAGGYKAFDRFATEQGAALIVSAEDPESVIRMRIDAFVLGHGWDRSRVLGNIHILGDPAATLADARWRSHILEEARRTGARFVVFDPLADLLNGDENSNSELRPVLKFARELSAATGATPIFVHHAGKASQDKRRLDRIRGASALASAARTILFFEEADSGVRIEHLKMSRAPKVAPFILKRSIVSDPEHRATWLTATLLFADERELTRNRAEDFVIALVRASPRVLTTSALKAAANGSGFSGEDIGKALAALQAARLIAFKPAARNAKLWYLVSNLNASSEDVRDDVTRLPTSLPPLRGQASSSVAPMVPIGWLGA